MAESPPPQPDRRVIWGTNHLVALQLTADGRPAEVALGFVLKQVFIESAMRE
jgi:hypothetical protein